MNRGNALLFIRRTIRLAHPHTPQSDCRDLQALLAEFACAQCHKYLLLTYERNCLPLRGEYSQ